MRALRPTELAPMGPMVRLSWQSLSERPATYVTTSWVAPGWRMQALRAARRASPKPSKGTALTTAATASHRSIGTAPKEQAQPYSSPALPIAEFGASLLDGCSCRPTGQKPATEPSTHRGAAGFSKGLEERYELGEQVGKGASSIVYAAVDKKTGVRCRRRR